jgi:hypothetical protein
MRLSWQLLTISLLPVLAHTRLNHHGEEQGAASVYLHPAPEISHSTSLSPSQANAVLVSHLGIAESSDFDFDGAEEGAVDGWTSILRQVGGHPIENVVGAGQPNALVLLIHTDHPEGMLPDEMHLSFSIPPPLSAVAFADLLTNYLERASSAFEFVTTSLPSRRLLKGEIPDLDNPGRRPPVYGESKGLVSYAKKHRDATGAFAALTLNEIDEIEKSYGLESPEYKQATQELKAFFQSDDARRLKLAVIVVPRHTSPNGPRGGPTPDVKPLQKSLVPHVPSFCFTTKESCVNSTDGCSGRGSCVETTRAGHACYSCVCSTTKNKKGKKQSWAGIKCEREDISSQFVLLVGTTVFLLFLTVGAVYLLYSIGTQELPSTLVASTAVHKRD